MHKFFFSRTAMTAVSAPAVSPTQAVATEPAARVRTCVLAELIKLLAQMAARH
jgi:hypothetical protein